jgi:hypothetical protein
MEDWFHGWGGGLVVEAGCWLSDKSDRSDTSDGCGRIRRIAREYLTGIPGHWGAGLFKFTKNSVKSTIRDAWEPVSLLP